MFTYIEFIELFMISVLYWKGGKETGGERRKEGKKRENVRSNDLHIPALSHSCSKIQFHIHSTKILAPTL